MQNNFEVIIDIAKRMRESEEMLCWGFFVERLGKLVAVVGLPFDRDEALHWIDKIGGTFQPTALTLVQDGLKGTVGKDTELRQGMFNDEFQATGKLPTGTTETLVISRAERIDNESQYVSAMLPYAQEEQRFVWSEPEFVYSTGGESVGVESPWIEAIRAAVLAPDTFNEIFEEFQIDGHEWATREVKDRAALVAFQALGLEIVLNNED